MLLNVMDVFIKEPLMDWEKLARRLVREQNVPSAPPPQSTH
jgi:hypothetical protein